MNYELNVSEFRDLFAKSDVYHGFSYEALGLIFEYYEENEPDFSFNFAEINGMFTEYESFESLERYYSYLIDTDEYYQEIEDEDEKIDYLINEIEWSENVTPFNHKTSFLIRH